MTSMCPDCPRLTKRPNEARAVCCYDAMKAEAYRVMRVPDQGKTTAHRHVMVPAPPPGKNRHERRRNAKLARRQSKGGGGRG